MRAYSEAGLELSVQDMIIQNMRLMPSVSSNLGRIRKASSNRCGGIRAVAESLTQNFLSTAHSLENQVKVFTSYSRHFKKQPQLTFLLLFLLRSPPQRLSHAHMLPAEQPPWTQLSSEAALHFPTCCAWSNSYPLPILQGLVQSPHSFCPALLCVRLSDPSTSEIRSYGARKGDFSL